MKVGIDANLSERTVRAMNALFSGNELSFSLVGAGKASSDAPWIGEFAREGGTAFIGLDKAIMRRPHEVEALVNSGLYAFFLDFGKSQLRGHEIASYLIHWWPEFQRSIGGENRIFRTSPNQRPYHTLQALRIELVDGVKRVIRV